VGSAFGRMETAADGLDKTVSLEASARDRDRSADPGLPVDVVNAVW